ncbi:hypothetical protein DY000_02019851 [Brassica cretica]|uniref:RNase H type-1 domain-containing protein n=1 Tax=Brassica cretica TaxID=69181 RepID=A0ABQ7CPQ4_BRACR|nr:hypothetical protein DY000_02019851 [Brassica cretica]
MSSYTWTTLPPYGFTSNAFPWLCWFLWTSRNQLLFEKKPSTTKDVTLKAIIAIKEWDQVQQRLNKPPLPLQPLHTQSPQPHHSQISICNTDAAWRVDSWNGGLAWIFTDQEGTELNCGSLFQDHISSACMAEALAVRYALLHAMDLNINHIWLRSNSQVLIRALSSGRRSIELYGVLSDIETISSMFFSCRFSFIKRELNGPADLYAKA